MDCSNCQTANPAEARFCMACGTALSSTCRSCGTSLPSQARFCYNCGQQVGSRSAPASVAEDSNPEKESRDRTQARLDRFIASELPSHLEAVQSSPESEGERRIVTVLFCDVAESTAMAEHLDPEVWTEIMNEAFNYLTVPVSRYEGKLARLMGDAILALFGAPIAHEDDPERAILAALDIVNGIGALRQSLKERYGLDFNVRVGISSGHVVVGQVGSSLASEYTAMGNAANLAARMEQTAQPGTVQVSADTYRLVAPLFDFEPLGPLPIKGMAEPVSAYRVLGTKQVPGRVRGIEGISAPLVGRDRELDILKQTLPKLRQGQGQIVCLIGEAGLGKSRLLQELRTEWFRGTTEPGTWMESHGVSYDIHRPYALFQRRVKEMLGVEETDTSQIIQQKISQNFPTLSSQEAALCTMAAEAIMSAKTLAENEEVNAEAIKRDIFEKLPMAWRIRATQHPMVMVFDDIHWSDAASVELLSHMFQMVEDVPVLFLCALRPERQSPAWGIRQEAETRFPHRYTEIALQPLSAENVDRLVSALLSIEALPPALRQQILTKADGNPFFVEEMVRSLIDRGAVIRTEQGCQWNPETRAEDIAVPETLHALLLARIDRLDREARRTLQMAAIIGRTFYHRLLQVISDATMALERHMNTLQRVELVSEASRDPELEYMFRHELAREAAYDSILTRRRRELHRRVGEAIETLFGDRLEEHATRLAYHFTEGGDNGRAMTYYTMAGDSAAGMFANAEAATHYTKALQAATHAGATPDQVASLYRARARVLDACGRHEEAHADLREAERSGNVSV